MLKLVLRLRLTFENIVREYYKWGLNHFMAVNRSLQNDLSNLKISFRQSC